VIGAKRMLVAPPSGSLPMPRILLALALILTGSLPLAAQQAGALVVRETWSRATPGGAKVGAGYLTVENKGTAPDRLVAAEAESAGRVEIHETQEAGGVSRMSPVSAVTVAPGGRLAFKPGGHHLMLVDLKQPLKQGERFKGILVFEKAGRIPVEFEVRAIGAGAEHGSHHAH
jgi:hypothetical protein